MLGLSDIKTGARIIFEGAPYLITWNQFSKSGRQGGVMKTKMKNLITGKTMEKTFQGSDKVESADISYRRAQFLYANGEDYDFMDQETFETITLSTDVLDNAVHYLVEGMDVDLQFFNGSPINIQLKPKMSFEITWAEPGVKGDTASGGNKLAKISTGLEVRVPFFIKVGERIIINTDTGEIGRAHV